MNKVDEFLAARAERLRLEDADRKLAADYGRIIVESIFAVEQSKRQKSRAGLTTLVNKKSGGFTE